MIWYEYPSYFSKLLFVMYLSSAALQTIIILELSEWMKEKQTKLFFHIMYLLFLGVSLVNAWEFIYVISSIDIGAFIPVVTFPRYICVLPILMYFSLLIKSFSFHKRFGFCTLTIFVPLLRIPQLDNISAFLSVFFALFTAAWFIADALNMLWIGRKHSKLDITRDILRYMIQSLDYGICIADKRGFIIESNPAFEKMWHALGLSKVDRVIDMEANLKSLCSEGIISIIKKDNYQIIKKSDFACLLRIENFKTIIKTYRQLSMSNITPIQIKITELEKENAKLEKTNRKLEAIIANIMVEASYRQREKLNRATHDVWSHKLAVTGLSLDMLIKQKEKADITDTDTFINYSEIKRILMQENSSFEEGGLTEFLSIMISMYKELGVIINVKGKTLFSNSQQRVLCSVIREGFANAVRHAYARSIEVVFDENESTLNMSIINNCMDNNELFLEGRGLFDIKSRIKEIGGYVEYKKNDRFYLVVVFPKDNNQGVVGYENSIN